jgi:cell division protein FtsW (lipid II flippase)
MRNASAWVIGAVLAQLVARLPPTRLFRAVWLLAPMALLIGLLGPGQSGVHRWISLGPLNWNVAFLALPAATVAIAAAARGPSRAAWWAALVMELGLCLQPDASQATAFAAAIVVALLMERPLGRVRLAVGLFFVLATGIAWTRPDPLKPLPEVEGILELACAVSWPMAILCVASLAAVIASPLSALSKAFPDARSPAVALGVYFLACTLAPLFGAFPVPLIGIGMSPILGFWLGIGALMAACRSEPDRPSA